MRQTRTLRRVTLLLAFAAFTLVSCDSADTGVQEVEQPQAPYEIRVFGPPLHGVQKNRKFTVTLAFFEPGTNKPSNVKTSETLTLGVVSGPGSLSGITALRGNGSSTLAFTNLVLNLKGLYTLQAGGTSAVASQQTAGFFVGDQLDLRFSFTPGTALKDRLFSVTVETVATGTQQPMSPGHTPGINLTLNSGSGLLGGTLLRTMLTGHSAVFNDLTYTQLETITLRASAYGFADVVSSPIPVDGIALVFRAVPSSVRVNSLFSITLDLKSQLTGAALQPNVGVTAGIAVATGTGNLVSPASATSVNGTLTFSPLKYDEVGQASFMVWSSETPSVTCQDIAFGVDLQAFASGPSTQPPGAPWPPFQFRLVDGLGALWTGPVSPLNWVVTNATNQTVQGGQASFASGMAMITPGAISAPGGYALKGEITSPANDTASIGLTVSSLVMVNEPGPFVSLKSVRVGSPYSDSVAFAVPSSANGFGLLAGNVPAGLSLSTTTGQITGTPTVPGSYEFAVYATLGTGGAQRIRCSLAVFSIAETEIVSGQNFSAPGPFAVSGPHQDSFNFVSSYDGVSYPLPGAFPCRMQFYIPDFLQAPSPAPVFIHHRGRGFNMDDYDNLGQHLASYGIIFISIENYQSFYDGGSSGQMPSSSNDGTYPERGMMSASAFQEAAMAWLALRDGQTGHILHNRVDVERVFMGGHSRGGGATQGSHVRSQSYTFNGTGRPAVSIRGVIYMMAFDLRYFASTAAGNANVYPVPGVQARLPSLIIAAENDGDLAYPICDQFIDRASGPTTFATIYGGCHNFMGDTNVVEGLAQPYISRAEQQAVTFNLVVAFIRRWANLDLSLEGLLYNNELAGSNEVGVTAWRNMAECVVVDDHQDASRTSNTLGGANSLTAGAFANAGVYPVFGGFASLGIKHAILTLNPATVATYTSNVPAGSPDISRAKRLICRIGQVSVGTPDGFDWLTLRVRLVDQQNNSATVTLFDRSSQNNEWLPNHPGGGANVFDRFVDANLPLAKFVLANPALTTSQIQRIELIFETMTAAAPRQLYFDDLRLE